MPLDGIATEKCFHPTKSTACYRCEYEVERTSAESAYFVEKCHTKIKNALNASPMMEVIESKLDDEGKALFNCLAEADKKVDRVCMLFEKLRTPFTSQRRRSSLCSP
ncbi:hypothetical protein Plhal304r1_c029g0096561 [Plasmopara halstedii]